MRLKVVFFLIAFMGSMVLLVAQDKPSFIGVRGGASFPYGEYHAKTLYGGSFTLTGFNVSAEGAWFFMKKLGIGASVGVNMHPVDVSSYGWERVVNHPLLVDVTIRSEAYMVITAMAGPYFQTPIFKKFSFTSKLLVGLLYGKSPYQLHKAEYYPFGLVYEEKTSATDYKFSWQAGIGLRYDISPCFGLVFDSEIFYDKLIFGFNTSQGGVRYDEHIISFINTTLGIRFNL